MHEIPSEVVEAVTKPVEGRLCGKAVEFGWEEASDQHHKRFILKIEVLGEPPAWPASVLFDAWRLEVSAFPSRDPQTEGEGSREAKKPISKNLETGE